MTVPEFYNEFNILYNNVMSNQAFPLDLYEISVLLTMAQEELVLSLYKGSPVTGTSFEGTEESRRYVSNLISTNKPILDSTYAQEDLMTEDSKAYSLPPNTLMITNEFATIVSTDPCLSNKRIKVVPTLQDELDNILNNPFRESNLYRALRLDLSNNKVEIISPHELDYKIRYLRKPNPIILKDLSPEEVSIDGKTESATSELDSLLHKTIIKMAVQLAKISYGK